MKILFLTNKKAENKEEIIDFIQMYGDEVIICYDKFDKEYVKSKKVDFIVSDRYSNLVPKDALDYLNGKAINTHPSLLPLNIGWQPNFFSIYNNTRTGVTIHYMDEEIDTGDIIIQQELFFNDQDTLRTTHYICRRAIIHIFCSNWYKIKNNDIKSIPQPNGGNKNFKKDFDRIFHTFHNGWDTTVKEIKEYRKEI